MGVVEAVQAEEFFKKDSKMSDVQFYLGCMVWFGVWIFAVERLTRSRKSRRNLKNFSK